MIRREGDRLVVSGPATLQQIAGLLDEGARQVREGVRVVDLGEVSELDSSLLAVLIAWMREAGRRGGALAFERLPADLATIAGLYGVADLLPAASSVPHTH